MGLPARDSRALDRIEHRLRDGDPTLAGVFDAFTKLSQGEQMPAQEQLSRAWHRPLRVLLAAARPVTWVTRRTRPGSRLLASGGEVP